MISLDFTGQVILVTGAGSGLGAAMARGFLEAGGSVVAIDVRDEALETLRGDGNDSRLMCIRCDVSQEEEMRRSVAAAEGELGRLDIACNNAGISQPLVRLADLPTDDFDRVFAVNTRGVFLGMKYQLPLMLRQGGGVILNTASIGALRGFRMFAAYNASKAAVISLTKTAATEYGRKNIRVNALCPGAFESSLLRESFTADQVDLTIKDYPIRRVASAEEIAATALWLCSNHSRFTTGQTVVIDGGKIQVA